MRPKTDIIIFTRWAHRDAHLIKDLDAAFMSKNPYKADGYYWLVSNVERINEDKFEYTLTKPCQTIAEWELEHKPSITTKEEAERLLTGSGGKKPFGLIENKPNKPDVIYIAGAISGNEVGNRHRFTAAKHNILASSNNAVVLNPAELPDGLTQAQYMSICLPMVMAADTVYMLVDWEKSKGAVAEHALAEKLNINIEYQHQPGE